MLLTKPMKPNAILSQLESSNKEGKVMNNLPKEEAIKGAFFGAIVGDALCLGSHYEYDAAKIFSLFRQNCGWKRDLIAA